ncbi:MAG TPA: ATP-binding protein [Myxococcota bacterium]|nr:ATP-binding protein [Myxococcota bacterium]
MSSVHDRSLTVLTQPFLKPIDGRDIAPPPIATRGIDDLAAAIRDTSSYDALLLMGVSPASNRVVKRLVARCAETPVFACKIDPLQTDLRYETAAVALRDAIDRAELPEELTLYLYWEAGALGIGPAALRLRDLLRQLNARPGLRVVVATPATCITDRGFDNVEARTLDALRWDLDAVGLQAKVEKYLRRNNLPIDAAQAALALSRFRPQQLPSVIRYAAVLAQRHHADVASTPPAALLADLEDAATILVRRTQRPKDEHEDTRDTSYVEQFLVDPSRFNGFNIKNNVAGVPKEVKQFLKLVQNFDAVRAVLPDANKTLLLKGPPGTGKTTIARALASEAGYPLFTVQSSELINKYIGASQENVRKLFRQAREYARQHNTTAVLFFDEADAMMSRRGGGEGGEREYGRVVNAFLENLQGFDVNANERLVVIAATNLDASLDPGVIRRFSSKVLIGVPDGDTLKEIFQIHLQRRALEKPLTDKQLDELGVLASGFTGSNVVNALDAAGRAAQDVWDPAAGPLVLTFEGIKEAVRGEQKEVTASVGLPANREAPEGMYI